MAQSRAALRERIRRCLGNRTDLDTEIDAAIDEACASVMAQPWRELETRDSTMSLSTSAQFVELPAGVDEVLRVVVENSTASWQVEYVSRAEAERRYPVGDLQAAGSPVLAYREGGSLYFAPRPEAALSVRIWYRAVLSVGALATGTASVEGFDELIAAAATALVFESIEHASESAKNWWRTYERRVAEKRARQGHSGVVLKINDRLNEQPDPRVRDWRIAWWR